MWNFARPLLVEEQSTVELLELWYYPIARIEKYAATLATGEQSCPNVIEISSLGKVIEIVDLQQPPACKPSK